MNMTAFFKAVRKFVFLAFALLLCGCIYTKSGNKNFNRNIEITVTLGKAYIDISGHIGEDIYLDTGKKDVMNTTVKNPVVMQGQKTINKKILLHATQKFEYTLTTAEIVIMTIKSIDDNDVTITVFEYGKTTEYKIDGKNKFGQTILFRN